MASLLPVAAMLQVASVFRLKHWNWLWKLRLQLIESVQRASAAVVELVQVYTKVPFVPGTVAILLSQVKPAQVLAAQPLSTRQSLVPGIQARLFQHVAVVQVLAAQELSAQILVPGIQTKLFQQVVVLQVSGAQELSAQSWVLQACDETPEQGKPPLAGVGLVQVRVWVPPPQAMEQVPKAAQPPSMILGAVPLVAAPPLIPAQVQVQVLPTKETAEAAPTAHKLVIGAV